MNRFDRALGILMVLRGGTSISARELAERFEVSRRTIYRDMEALGEIGVPVFAERGREGGLRLLDGYFLSPVMFSQTEAVSLLLAITMLQSLRVRPFPGEMEAAEEKLLAVLPANIQVVLAEARKVIGTETAPHDAFRPGMSAITLAAADSTEDRSAAQSAVVSTYLQAIFDRRVVAVQYRSPYRGRNEDLRVEPLGIFQDRNQWYLVGRLAGSEAGSKPRLLRADRVIEMKTMILRTDGDPGFDVRDMLDRRWLMSAIEQWAEEVPVKIRITEGQWKLLKEDWYYRYVRFEKQADGSILMTLGEDNSRVVFDLLRWLGPGAELIEPAEWRQAFRAQLEEIVADYRQ